MTAKEVKILIGKSILFFNEDHERFPGIIKSFNLTETGEVKPYRMFTDVSETSAGKGKVLNKWTFKLSEEDIDYLISKKEVHLTREFTVDDKTIDAEYRGIVI